MATVHGYDSLKTGKNSILSRNRSTVITSVSLIIQFK